MSFIIMIIYHMKTV